MRKWNLSLTYEPKIEPVLIGKIRQTIRIGRKFNVGDLISFHGWSGKPYHSSWTFKTPYAPLVTVINCVIYPDSLMRGVSNGAGECRKPWSDFDCLAERDGIVPPTGEALRDVLISMNKIPIEGLDSQIIRW